LKAPVTYNVEISPVREIALRGSADLSFWTSRLEREELLPADDGGTAQVLITAMTSKFMGIPFGEVSVAVFVRGHDDGGDADGVFLAHAFNSSRLFAFVERTFFHTPYCHARLQLDCRLPAAFGVFEHQRVILGAKMSESSMASARHLSRTGEEGWEGPIYLPSGGPAGKRRVFFGRIGGHTHAYPFTSDDVLTLAPSKHNPIVAWLAESGFAPKEWTIRKNATHARSRSVDRRRLQLSPAGQAG